MSWWGVRFPTGWLPQAGSVDPVQRESAHAPAKACPSPPLLARRGPGRGLRGPAGGHQQKGRCSPARSPSWSRLQAHKQQAERPVRGRGMHPAMHDGNAAKACAAEQAPDRLVQRNWCSTEVALPQMLRVASSAPSTPWLPSSSRTQATRRSGLVDAMAACVQNA